MASVAPAPLPSRSPVTLMTNATFELHQNPLLSAQYLMESGVSPWSSPQQQQQQQQTGFPGSKLSSISGTPASSVTDGDHQNNEAEVRRLEALLDSANKALLAMWEERSGLASQNRQLEADLQIVAEEAALAQAMIDQNARRKSMGQSPASIQFRPPAAAADKQVRELEATKKELEQRVSAMATEASCVQSGAKRLLKEVEDRFRGDMNDSSSLSSAYQSLLKSVSGPLHREDTAPGHCGANEDNGMMAVPRVPQPPTSRSPTTTSVASEARTTNTPMSRSSGKNASAASATQPSIPLVPQSSASDEGGKKKFVVRTSGYLRTGGSGARYTSSASSTSSGSRPPLLYRKSSEPAASSSSSPSSSSAAAAAAASNARRSSEGDEAAPRATTTKGQSNDNGIALAVAKNNGRIAASPDRTPIMDEPNTP